jgi:hypothetical protein
MKKSTKIILWAAQIIAAFILLQTLYFKFSGAEESVYIFSKLGVEPYGRIGSGVIELIAGIMLLIPATAGVGALIAMGVMAGAIGSHLTILGIDILGDGGQLFAYAVIVFVCCAFVAFIRRKEIPVIKNFIS